MTVYGWKIASIVYGDWGGGGVKDDILYLVFQLNKKAMITVRITVVNTEPFQINNIVKQGTVSGPVLNNCSLDDNCAEGQA